MRTVATRDYDYGDDAGGQFRPAGSLPFRLAAGLTRNPTVAGGAIACGIAVIAIVVNAIAYQPVRHPSPLFATRALAPVGVVPVTTTKITPPAAVTQTPAVTTPDVAAAEPEPTSIEQAIATNSVPAPRPRPSDTPSATAPTAVASTQLAERVQQALKDRGLYAGVVDGIPGPATAEAVKSFERAQGLPQTGEVSEHIAQLLRSDRTRPAAVPVRPVATTQLQPAAAAAPTQLTPPEPLTATIEGRLQRVQKALNVAGYGPVRTDGRFDAATSAAIRQFESEHAMPQTGQLSNRLVQELLPQSAQAR